MKEYDYKAIPAPSGEKICLTLPGPPAMTKKEESKMCDDLNYLVNIIISRICKSYTVLQSVFRDELHEQIGQHRRSSLPA